VYDYSANVFSSLLKQRIDFGKQKEFDSFAFFITKDCSLIRFVLCLIIFMTIQNKNKVGKFVRIESDVLRYLMCCDPIEVDEG
jgi:hypothetical protein